VILPRRNFAGSAIGGIPETQEMLDFCAKHKIASDIEIIPIQKISEAWEHLLKHIASSLIWRRSRRNAIASSEVLRAGIANTYCFGWKVGDGKRSAGVERMRNEGNSEAPAPNRRGFAGSQRGSRVRAKFPIFRGVCRREPIPNPVCSVERPTRPVSVRIVSQPEVIIGSLLTERTGKSRVERVGVHPSIVCGPLGPVAKIHAAEKELIAPAACQRPCYRSRMGTDARTWTKSLIRLHSPACRTNCLAAVRYSNR